MQTDKFAFIKVLATEQRTNANIVLYTRVDKRMFPQPLLIISA